MPRKSTKKTPTPASSAFEPLKTVIGIDVSKDKLDVYVCLDGVKSRKKSIENNKEGFEKLLKWMETLKITEYAVALEATGWYSEPISEYLHGHTVPVYVLNPAWVKYFAKSEGLRTKNDTVDAKLIAKYLRAHQHKLKPWTPCAPEYRALRDTFRAQHALKKDETVLKNRLEKEVLPPKIREVYQRLLESCTKEIAALEASLKAIVAADGHEKLRGQVERLCSMKGVAFLTAVGILAEVMEIERFEDPRQLAAFAGLTPFERSSGKKVGGGAISKMGSSRLRQLLYMPALSVKRWNEGFAPFVERLEKKGKRPKVIVVAVMRKMLHVIYGLLTNDEMFDAKKMLKEQAVGGAG